MEDGDTNLATLRRKESTDREWQNHFVPPWLAGASDKNFDLRVKWMYSAVLLTVPSLSGQWYCPVHSSSLLFGEELQAPSSLDLIVFINEIFIRSPCAANPK